jgi:hypothetical protein
LSISVVLTVTNGAYTIGDVMGGLITFPNAVSANGKHAVLYSVTLFGVVALLPELWLFNADIATPAVDNAVFNLAAADGAKYLGSYPLASGDSLAPANSFSAVTAHPQLMVKAGAATTSPGTTTMNLVADFLYVD